MEDYEVYKSYKKSPYRSIKHSTFFACYQDLFSKYVDKDITFLEIGVLGGGSLFMWRDFLGPNARIIGVDLNPGAKIWEDHGFEIFIGDQGDPKFLQALADKIGNIDVLLDDGGHTYQQQVMTVETFLTRVNDGGCIVVEDTHTSYMTGYGPRDFSFMKYAYRLCDKINMRFSGFDAYVADERVWNIQIYESMVAFHINKAATSLQSYETSNDGEDVHPNDFKNHDSHAVNIINRIAKKLSFLKRFSLLVSLKHLIVELIQKQSLTIKNYFK